MKIEVFDEHGVESKPAIEIIASMKFPHSYLFDGPARIKPEPWRSDEYSHHRLWCIGGLYANAAIIWPVGSGRRFTWHTCGFGGTAESVEEAKAACDDVLARVAELGHPP